MIGVLTHGDTVIGVLRFADIVIGVLRHFFTLT